MDDEIRFCPDCDNLLYLKHGDNSTTKLYKHCRNPDCKFEPQEVTSTMKVSTTYYSQNDTLCDWSKRNKYLKDDPTLPRTNDPSIVCENNECTRKQGEEQRILYYKYDAVNMRYFYSCEYCGNAVTPKKKLI